MHTTVMPEVIDPKIRVPSGNDQEWRVADERRINAKAGGVLPGRDGGQIKAKLHGEDNIPPNPDIP